MKKVFYLKTCSTCSRILKELDLQNWELREIKSLPITEAELAEMFVLSNSYESLFSKKSTQIKERNIDVKSLKEEDFRKLILEDYRFLKRPVFITDNEIFVGNDKHNILNLKKYFLEKK